MVEWLGYGAILSRTAFIFHSVTAIGEYTQGQSTAVEKLRLFKYNQKDHKSTIITSMGLACI